MLKIAIGIEDGSSNRCRRKKRLAHSKWNAVTDSEKRNWLDLPRDVVCKIFLKLGTVRILTRVQTVCKAWLDISKDPFLWHTIDMNNPDDRSYENIYESLCRRAVDYSIGNLVEINIAYFATFELLLHIAHSARHLRCLRLVGCYGFSDDGFDEITEKMSELEEVEISVGSLSVEAIEAFGRCCPRLKSFKFNSEVCREFFYEIDEEAFAIAKTMPSLCHLQLFGNMLTNAGLLAILDDCPHLESLDLRQCRNLVLGGSLGKRCAKHIKDLRLPNDAIGKCPYETEIHYDISEIDDINFLLGEDSDSYSDSYYDDSDAYDGDSDGNDDDDDDDDDDSDGYESSEGNEFSKHDYDKDNGSGSSQQPGMAPPSKGKQPQQQYQQLPCSMMPLQPATTSSQPRPPPPQQPTSTNEVRTLWIGNLQYWMDENYLYTVFAHTNEVTSVKVIRNKQTTLSEGYGFIEFNSRAAAQRVLQTYNRAIMPHSRQNFKLNWATFNSGERFRHDESPYYTIFVDLAADVIDYLLEETSRARYNSI